MTQYIVEWVINNIRHGEQFTSLTLARLKQIQLDILGIESTLIIKGI